MLLLCDLLENRRPVDNTLGAAETTGEVHQWQEFLAELNESEAGSSLLLCLSVCVIDAVNLLNIISAADAQWKKIAKMLKAKMS